MQFQFHTYVLCTYINELQLPSKKVRFFLKYIVPSTYVPIIDSTERRKKGVSSETY